MTIPADAAPDTVAVVASKATLVGAATSVAGWLSVNEVVALGGLLIAVVGFAVNWYYRHAADVRAREIHALEVQRLRDEIAEAREAEHAAADK